MLQVSHVFKSFGDKLVLNDISFILNSGQKAALVGPNGCGKTTLLKIIQGEIEPDRGYVRFSPASVRVGYLAQVLECELSQTVSQVLQTAVPNVGQTERRLETLTKQIAQTEGDDLAELLAAYERTLSTLEFLVDHDVQERAISILESVGLVDIDRAMPIKKLSGGQKTRFGLALVLLSSPDLLLLDEPTNHLDFEALGWLEHFLIEFPGAALVVSHDRAFLDRTASVILEIDSLERNLCAYMGNYSDYVKAKDQEREKQWAAYKDQQLFLARLESNLAAKKNYARSIEQGTIHFHQRKIAKGIARRAVVQQRRIERLLDSEERLDKPQRSWQMKLEFGQTPPSGRDVLRTEELCMGFGTGDLFRDVNLSLRAGERIALVGPNGSGKTTFLRLITGEINPTSGQIYLGVGVKLGYYAQEQEVLDKDGTPLEIIRSVSRLDSTEARSFLHYFLFKGDDVFVSVNCLSLGERARLTLAMLVAQGCNFLLLDEPLNHLDIPSRHQFELAIDNFQGTILVVVHDRYFIDRFATGLWAIKAGRIITYADREDMQRTLR